MFIKSSKFVSSNIKYNFILKLFVTASLSLSILITGCSATPTNEFGAQVKTDGSYSVESYSNFPEANEYSEATIYFPTNKSGAFAGVAVAPGFRESKENIDWWGPRLASHGFAVLALSTNTLNDRPEIRATALMAAINTLRKENQRDGSPLKGKIKIDAMAIMGHSMGGGGTLIAANDYSAELKAVIPLTPWQPNADFSKVSVPTLIIAGETDRIAAANTHALPHYEMIPESTEKMYVEFKGGNHFIANNSTATNERLLPNIDVHDAISYFAVSWLRLYLDGDENYRGLVYGNEAKQFSNLLSNHMSE